MNVCNNGDTTYTLSIYNVGTKRQIDQKEDWYSCGNKRDMREKKLDERKIAVA